ncbi:hypothetical protein GCM10018775_30820 [Streptomyces umbrinus]|nr:hypothetical protein GCM10018775_30820 [Streptomyces umbrinus]
MAGERGDGGVVEDQGRRQAQAGRGGQGVAEFDRGQGVEAHLAERPAWFDHRFPAEAQHHRHLNTHQVGDHGQLLIRVQTVQPTRQRGPLPGLHARATALPPDQPRKDGRNLPGPRV